ncbi:MAG: ATP-binding protein, partial [Thermoguttaceae bacterium]|nr:ATP-binding protein [Thermoguttaceae bacterium]
MKKPLKESLTVEFKSDQRVLAMNELYKEVVALANTEGGVVCLGVEDDGTVTGMNAQHDDIVKMAADIQTHTVPAQYTELHVEDWDGKSVLVIEVKPSRQLVMTSGGRYLRR